MCQTELKQPAGLVLLLEKKKKKDHIGNKGVRCPSQFGIEMGD